VIVPTGDLGHHGGRVTMVDGAFDPIHPGHVAYFRAAAELGHPVLCNISGDEYLSMKHPPLLTQGERAPVIDAIRYVDYTHLSTTTTAGVLRALRPLVYAKGVDWQDRLPSEEVSVCAALGIEIVFLDTVLGSSSDVLARYGRAAP
jgi:cytidyltransferase-like protein